MKWFLCIYFCFMWVILVIIFAYLFAWNKRLNEEEKKYRNQEQK